MKKTGEREFGRLKILDSIRGMAALIVLFHHIFKLNKNALHKHLSTWLYNIFNFISDLNLEAVLLFFIISGFSIGLSTFKRPLKNKDSLNSYLYRRFKRILPIYWISIILSLLIGIVSKTLYLPDFTLKNLIGNILFLQTSSTISESWVIPYGLNGPLWSLSFEMFFYLFFPVAYVLNVKYLNKVSVSIKYLLLVVLVLIGIVINKKVIFIPYFLFFGGFITWILGYLSSQFFTFWRRNDILFLTNLLVGLIIIILVNYIPSNTINVIAKGMFINGIFYFTMVYLDEFNMTKFKNTVNFLFYKIGEGSYAIYALHYPILIYFQNKEVPLIYQVLFWPLFIVACYFLEKKSLKWQMKFLEINYLKPITAIGKILH